MFEILVSIISICVVVCFSVLSILHVIDFLESKVDKPRLEDFDKDKDPESTKDSPIYKHEEGRLIIQICTNGSIYLEEDSNMIWLNKEEREWLRKLLNATKGEN